MNHTLQEATHLAVDLDNRNDRNEHRCSTNEKHGSSLVKPHVCAGVILCEYFVERQRLLSYTDELTDRPVRLFMKLPVQVVIAKRVYYHDFQQQKLKVSRWFAEV